MGNHAFFHRRNAYLFVTMNVVRPESLSILSIGTIDRSSLMYLEVEKIVKMSKIGGSVSRKI